jgi:AmiR/NasT family two-component response regulator
MAKVAEQLTGLWKTTTLAHPSWPIFNLVGLVWNAAMGRVPLDLIGKHAKDALRIVLDRGNLDALDQVLDWTARPAVVRAIAPERHRFTETEIKMLNSVAHQAAVAIENTRLVQDAVSSREELEARKTIERAKGVLMKERGWSEEEAFREMRKSAMDRRKSMKEIAEAILLSKEMKA